MRKTKVAIIAVVSVLLTLIGLAGVPEDLRTWLRWLAVIDHDIVRYFLVIVGLAGFAYLQRQRIREYCERLPFWPFLSGHGSTGKSTNDARPEEPKVYTASTVSEILAPIGDLTSLGIQRHVEPHIGKWIPVQSTVKDISADDRFFRVTVGKNKFSPDVFLLFERDKWGPLLETMDRGKRVAAEGKIHDVDYFGMQLVDCDIVAERENDDCF